MDEVFRFVFMRPPAGGAPVQITPSDQLAQDLRTAMGQRDSRASVKAVAAALVASGRGIKDLTAVPLGPPLADLDRLLGDGRGVDAKQLAKAIEQIFGHPAADVVALAEFGASRELLADNLIAAKLLSQDAAVTAATLEHQLRLLRLIERSAAGDPSLGDPDAVGLALGRPTLLDPALLGRPAGNGDPAGDGKGNGNPGKDTADELDKRRKALQDRISRLEQTARALSEVNPSDLDRLDQPADAAAGRSDAPSAALLQRVSDQVRSGELERIRQAPITEVVANLNVLASGSGEAAAARTPIPRLRLSRGAIDGIGATASETLRELGVDLTQTALPAAANAVTLQLNSLHTELLSLDPGTVYGMLGGSVVAIGPMTTLGAPGPVPTSHGDVTPAGVGDLLLVRQQLKRYEGGEVGYIENVLRSESRSRSTKRTSTTEETVTTEQELKTEQERDTQTTERFELKTEASSVVKEDSQFKAGLSLSASYGPTVEFKASTDFSMDKSKEESAKTASSYSKEVTDRASSKVMERHRTERVLHTIEVYEEANHHGFDNTAGNANISGVYQWVDKIYEAQIFNYGRRMLFDLMIPEPAAFWIYANTNQPPPGSALVKPVPFTLSPSALTPGNYAAYLQQYQVSGVNPPPEPYMTVAKTFNGQVTHDQMVGSTSTELPIPTGYRALAGHAIATGAHWDDHDGDWSMTVGLGQAFWRRTGNNYVNNDFTLAGELGSVSVGISTFAMSAWYVTIEVDTQRTPAALEAWQLATHDAIMQAYLKLDRDYRDELAALQNQAASQVQGRNPDDNAMVERTELKKAAISIFTAQQYDLFGAVSTSTQGYPETDLLREEPQGRYIRFFEQAFEWENVQYLFYPYFWGRKDNWLARAVLQDTDPEFAEFLKAGSARVVVPVRPGFEAAIAHFLDSGEIWDGADPPTLTSPLYVSIIDEIKERTLAPGSEVAQGDPWDVRLPTTLVKLRPDDALPAWHKDGTGQWVPV